MTNIIVTFDRQTYLIETNRDLDTSHHTLPGGQLDVAHGSMIFMCYDGGSVDVIHPDYRGFGSWQWDWITPSMQGLFWESVDDTFSLDQGIDYMAATLALSTVDAFELGNVPVWLVEQAKSILLEWQEMNRNA